MTTLLLMCLAAAAEPTSALRSLTLDAEVGPAFIAQNDNRYGETGTPYTAREVGQTRNLFVGKRLSVEARLGERHTAILLMPRSTS